VADEVRVREIRRQRCDYFDGMMYADEAKLRCAFHPKCLIVGHFRGRLEYDPLDAFIAACKAEGSIPPGTPTTPRSSRSTSTVIPPW
jgi:Putative lumazine-binding